MGSATAQLVSLGALVFDELAFEVPEDLEITYRTLGGTTDIPQTGSQPAVRVSQTLGVVVDPIKLSAKFIGVDADDRMRQLVSLEQQQAVVTFQYGGRGFNVVVFGVVQRFRSANDIGFECTIEPQSETNAGATSAAIQSASAALSLQMSIIGNYPPLTLPAGDPNVSELAPIAAAQTAAAAVTTPPSSLSDLQTLSATLSLANTALAVVAAAKQSSTDSSDVSTYLAASSLRGLVASSIATIGSMTGAASTATVNPNGLNAYQVAVRYTGDIANTDAILSANGLNDPFNLGSAPIVIPAALSTL